MQRGRIIQYNPLAGTGIVAVGGAQRAFEIRHWRGAEAPRLNGITEVEEEEGIVTLVAPVPERVLLAERASELKAGLGALGSGLGAIGATIGARAAEARAGSATADAASVGVAAAPRLDRTVVGGYALFVVATAFLTFVSIEIPFAGDRGVTLLGATGLADQAGSSLPRLLLFAAYASAAVPLVWKDRRAWLALLLPLAALALMGLSAARALAAQLGGGDPAAAAFLGEEALEEMRRAAAEMISFGLGLYASAAAALLLAAAGLRRFAGRA